MCSSPLRSLTQRNVRNTVRWWVALSLLTRCVFADNQRVFHEAGFDAYCVGFGEFERHGSLPAISCVYNMQCSCVLLIS